MALDDIDKTFLSHGKYVVDRSNGMTDCDGAVRRSISTLYYALFQSIISYAVVRSSNTTDEDEMNAYARKHDHKHIRNICRHIASMGSNTSFEAVEAMKGTDFTALVDMAVLFVKLQKSRHDSDYNRVHIYSQSDAERYAKQVSQHISTIAVMFKPRARDKAFHTFLDALAIEIVKNKAPPRD
ncbi:MAG: hypothetical protein Q8S73_07595 [Deltaproteobacteria bacterium]|nr:hypothetical protein [Myxococcales bacterium]MDP3213951.1 hypothetical protein [Deltaproteobacteria bacterium]